MAPHQKCRLIDRLTYGSSLKGGKHMRLPRLFRTKKSRRYPIKRDGKGKSLRSRCFELFGQEKRPVEVAEELRMKVPTACRYFRDWKQLGPNFERQHAYFKELLKKTAPHRERTIELCARACGITKEQFETILSQPHGLRRLMTGKFYFTGQADADHKRYVALELVFLISDHLIKNGGKFEDVAFAFRRWLRESQESRQEEDAEIKEENKDIAFMRRILEASAENERQGRAEPDRLSDEERNAILRGGLKSLSASNSNVSARRIRSTPDLFVFDRKSKESLLVEVKTSTTRDESKCFIAKAKLDDYASYWAEAILVMYCLRSGNLYCQRIGNIQRSQLKVNTTFGKKLYELNLPKDFLTLPDLFKSLEAGTYSEFYARIRGILSEF
jgi:hypothetical protein